MLRVLNGFYAFEGALHVFPVATSCAGFDLLSWNSENLWRDRYRDLAIGYFFFAEDVFGGQYAIKNEGIYSFDAETGEASRLADGIEGWAKEVLEDFEFLTGYPLAHEWQRVHGPLGDGIRLIPKRPFVLGGEFSIENLYSMDAARSMRLRGDLALQLRDLPDGASVEFKIIE